MSCKNHGFNLSPNRQKDVDYVAKGNKKMATILAMWLYGEDGFVEFAESTNDPLWKGIENTNGNTIRKLLFQYWKQRFPSVSNFYSGKTGLPLYGFETISATITAKNYVADIIFDLSKTMPSDIDKSKFYIAVAQKIVSYLNKDIIGNIIASDKFVDRKLEYYNKMAKWAKILNNPNSTNEEKSKARSERTKYIYDIIDSYGTYTQKNYANLTKLIRSQNKEFLDYVYSSYKLREVGKGIFTGDENYETEYINDAEDNTYINDEADSIDEMMRHHGRDSTMKKDFTEIADNTVRDYLNSIYKLESAESRILDTNNELGVPTKMNYTYIIHELINRSNINSLNEFIESIKEIALKQSRNAGLIKVYEDIKNNSILANLLYTQVRKPFIIKTILDFNGSEISLNRSNRDADIKIHLFNNTLNAIKTNLKIEAINRYNDLLNNILRDINLLSKLNKNSNEYGKLYSDCVIRLKDTLSYFVNNFTNEDIDNYLNYGNSLDNIRNIINKLQSVLEEGKKLSEKFNKDYKKYRQELTDSKLIRTTGESIKDPEPLDYDSYFTPAFYKALNNLVETLVDFTYIKNDLNSPDSGGNLGSDVIANSWLTNLVAQIQYRNENDANAGLFQLLSFYAKSKHHRKNHILFDQVVDGIVISKGMASLKEDGTFTINKDAKDLFNIALFNGIRSLDKTPVNYETMSNVDYLTAMLSAFHKVNGVLIDGKKRTDIGGYFARTPSDAPKNFIIYTKKINTENLFIPKSSEVNDYFEKWINDNISFNPNYKNSFVNNITETQLIEYINNIPISIYLFNNSKFITNKNNKTTISYQYIDKNKNKIIITFSGVKVNNRLQNIKRENITVVGNNINNSLRDIISKTIVESALKEGKIKRYITRNSIAFKSIKNQVIREIEDGFRALINISDYKTDANGVTTISIKKDLSSYSDSYYRRGEKIIEDGKLVGNVFKYYTLFEVNGYNAGKELERSFSFYGGSTLNKIWKDNRDGTFSLNLNEELNEELDNIIEKWIENYLIESNRYFDKYSRTIDPLFTLKEKEDYAINAFLTYIAMDDLMEGNPKYYKNVQDLFKRNKEVQAGGQSYSNIDFSSPIGESIKEIDKIEIPRRGGIGSPITISINTGWKGVTIKNTSRASRTISDMRKYLTDIITKNKQRELNVDELPKEYKSIVKITVDAIVGGFEEKTKTNDAQSYITIEEFVRRHYLDGTYDKYKDLIEQLIDPNTKLEDINYTDLYNFIQAQKNFYFDQYYDPVDGEIKPRQIKNAEFVLIPALLPEDSGLKSLYDSMKKNGIDQVNTVETDKAAKRDILEFFDNNGNITEENKKTFDEKVSNGIGVENYYYKYLYKQQDVPQHIKDERNKIAVQISKKIFDNYLLGDKSVKKAFNDFQNAYVAKIKKSFNKTLKKLNLTLNKDGSIKSDNGIINLDSFYKIAREEAQRLNVSEDFIKYLTTDKMGSPLMPNWMNSVSMKIESIVQAIFNRKITRQTLPGWHTAQVSNIGYDNDLKYHPAVIDENGNITQQSYMEVYLPRWSSLIPKTMNADELPKDLQFQIAYRIPTEGKQSIITIKVKGFLPDAYGSTIIVPEEWVTQTGSDFDIDSVYGICHNIRSRTKYEFKDGEILTRINAIKKVGNEAALENMLKFGDIKVKTELFKLDFIDGNEEEDIQKRYDRYIKYEDKNITLEKFKELSIEDQNIVEALENRMIDSFIYIMMNDNSIEEHLGRSNYDDLSRAKTKVESILSKENSFYDSPYSFISQIINRDKAQSGATLKAFSVNRDTFTSICNVGRVYMDQDIIVIYDLNSNEYNENIIKEAYGNDVNTLKDNYISVRHRRIGWSNNNKNVKGKLITSYSSQTTAHILDAVKVGSLFNENKYTFGSFKTLIDLGIDYYTAELFLAGKGITRIVDAYNFIQSNFSDNYGKPYEIALKRLAIEYNLSNDNGEIFTENSSINEIYRAIEKNTGIEIPKTEKELHDYQLTLNQKDLIKRITSNDFFDQVEQIVQFMKLYYITSKIESLVQCSNPDKFGAKQDVRSTRTILENINKYRENTILYSNNKSFINALYPLNDNGYIDINNSFYPFLAAFLQMSTKLSVDANSKVLTLESDNIYNLFNYIQEKYGFRLTSKQYKDLQKYAVSYLYNIIGILTQPQTIDSKNKFITDTNILKSIEDIYEQWTNEYLRIKGYTANNTNNIIISDINKPTKEDIDNFAKLTPAQKIIFIRNNFKYDLGVFEFIRINTFNQREYKEKGSSAQYLYFNDKTEDINNIHQLFNKAAFSSNPLIRLALLDVVKYAFIVDGGRFKRNSVGKIITSEFLSTSIDKKGTGITDDGIQKMTKVFNIQDFIAKGRSYDLFEKYIRQNPSIIKTVRIPFNSEFNSLITGDIIRIPLNSFGERFMEFIGFSTVNSIEPNQFYEDSLIIESGDNSIIIKDYIRLQTGSGRNIKTTLYKAYYKPGKGLYYYPINLLDQYEVTDYSINAENNKYRMPKFYINLIDKSIRENISIKDLLKNIGNTGKVSKLINAKNIISLSDRTVLQTRANKGIFSPTQIISSKLNDKVIGEQITIGIYPNIANGYVINELVPNVGDISIQEIAQVSSTGEPYKTPQTYLIIRKGTNLLLNQAFKIAKIESIEAGRKLLSNNPNLLDVFNDAIIENQLVSNNPPILIDVKKISPVEENDTFTDELASMTDDIDISSIEIDSSMSEVDKLALNIYNDIKRKKHKNDKYKHYAYLFERANINAFTVEGLKNGTKTIFAKASNLYPIISDIMIKNADNFNDTGYSLDDERLYLKAVENPILLNELINYILEVCTLGNSFGGIFSFDVTSTDHILSKQISDIKESIDKIRSNTKIKNALRNLIDITIKQYSNNPLIKEGIIKLSTQFGDAYLFDSIFSDIHELNNSEIQTIVKYVETAHEVIMQTIIPEQVSAMKNKIAEFKKRGVNLSKLSHNGHWITNYNEQFIKDKQRIYNNLEEARVLYGEFSPEYQKAYLEKEKWFTNNVERRIDNDYYVRRTALLDRVITKALNIYIEYKRLRKEIADVNNFNNGELSDEQLEKRKELAIKLRQLMSELNSDGTPKSDEEIEKIKILKQFNTSIIELNSQYFESITEEGFEENLQRNLDILIDYDKHHKEYTLEEKLKNKEYLDAYTWIQINTIFDVNADIKQKVFNAFKVLGANYDAKRFFKEYIAKHPEIIDADGIIDGSKVSEQAVSNLKQLFEQRYSKDSDTPFVTGLRKDYIMDTEIPRPTPQFWADLGANKKTAYNEELDNIHKEINEILDKCIDENGHISSKKLFDLGNETVKKLLELYNTEHELRKGIESDREWVKRFKQSVDFKYNNTAFKQEFNWALTNLSKEDLALWKAIFAEKKGSTYLPNSSIYGYFVPKDEKYIDINRKEALKIIEDNVEFVPTKYYYKSRNEAIKRDEEEPGYFDRWFNDNHVYNSFNGKYEPLNIWTQLHYKNNPNGTSPYKYKPVGEFVRNEVKEEYKNSKYKKYGSNFNGKNEFYKSKNNLTDDEQEAIEYFKELMATYFNDDKALKFINRDNIPHLKKKQITAKDIIKQTAGLAGISMNSSPVEWTDEIGYEYDVPINFSMFDVLKSKDTKERIKQRRQLEGESDKDYLEYVKKIRKENEKIDKENAKISEAISENDLEIVFEEFLKRAIEYNSKERQKPILYMLVEDLKRNKAYKETGLNNKLRKDRNNSIETNNEYIKEDQRRNRELVETYIRRFIYGEYKEPHKLNVIAGFLQNYTSAKYMMLNATGGVTNVLTGFVNIWGEQFARQYFTTEDIRKAEFDYMSSIPQIFAGIYDDKGRNLVDAIIKRMNVVDFDKNLERQDGEDLLTYTKRIKNFFYSMQSTGEHFMQSTVLLAMLRSHRIFKNSKGEYISGTYAQYIEEIENNVLKEILADNEVLLRDYNQYINEIKRDEAKIKDYAQFKRDINEYFLRIYCSNDIKKEYIKRKKEAVKKAKEEFNKFDTVYSQFEFKDGNAVIKQDSHLTNEMLALIKGETISVNKKIHGVYDKIGAAQLEKKWFGSLLMQYHKHIYPGMMKRFRIRGYYNEFRNSVEKGSYISLYKFLSIEFKNISNKNKTGNQEQDASITVLEGIQNIFKATINLFANSKFNYELLPEWEKANIRRLKGDLCGIIGGFTLLLVLSALRRSDDDDILDSNMYNFGLYVADRWFTESNAMTPWGIFTEFKSLYSQPFPAASGMNDIMKLLNLTSQYLFDDDFDPIYKSGKYKDENKFARIIINNSPIYRNIERIGTMNKHNQYYKFDDNSMRNAIIDNVIEYSLGD